MDKNRKLAILLLFVSALLVAITFNLGTFRWVLGLFEPGNAGNRPGRYVMGFQFGLFISVFEFTLFLVFAFFNYTWKDRLFQWFPVRSKTLALIAVNLLLFTIMVYLKSAIFHAYFDDFPRRMNTHYFILSSYPVAGIAIAEAYFLILFRKMQLSEVEKARLKEEKSNAELAALKDQLSPHFFFNTLSSLSTIIRSEDKKVGLEFIQEMSQTYRYTLASRRQDLVSVQEEMDFLQSYIFLIKKRFGDKIDVVIDLSENTYLTRVPPMSVQLLVENAIQHNVITRAHPLTVNITDDEEYICVENALNIKENNSAGIGLKNLADRYRLLADKEIVIEKSETHFRVKLPLI